MLPAVLSHGLAALAFAAFAALLLANAEARARQRSLLAASILTAVWAAAVATSAAGSDGIDPRSNLTLVAQLLEPLRTAAWLAVLIRLLQPASLPLKRVLLLVAGLLAAQLAGAEWRYSSAMEGSTIWSAMVVTVPRLLLAVAGLLLVELLFRQAMRVGHRGLKYASFAMGVLFAYDFYLYSDALLFRRLQADLWAARGLVDAFSVPLLAFAATRQAHEALPLTLSRTMLLRSAMLLGCGLYLLGMAASAWYLRSVGGNWGRLMQLVCLCGALLLLLGVLLSGAVRAKARVFISRHFYQSRYDYRDEWQRISRMLSESTLVHGDTAVRAMASVVASSAGALWLRREASFVPEAAFDMSLPRSAEAAGSDFCVFLEAHQWVVDTAPGACSDGPTLPPWLYGIPGLALVVPLMLHKRLYGFVALAGNGGGQALHWETRDLLRLAGSQVASWLAANELAERLAVARQFDSFNRLSTFVIHDLKNLVGQLAVLLSNAERHGNDPAFQQDMLLTVGNAVQKMEAMLQRLNRHGAGTETCSVALQQLLGQVAHAYRLAKPRPVLEMPMEELCVRADSQQLERVLCHLVQNAVDATAPDGQITLKLIRNNRCALIELCDSGCGMRESFLRERLFRPFESSKAGGMGIGVFESREYVRELGGQLEVRSVAGKGSTFTITLPLYSAAAAA